MKVNGSSQDQIRARAFEIYLQRGGQPGHELDDWLQAEFELTHLPLHVVQLQPIRARRSFSLRQRGRFSVRFSKR
jgi:hypothetical protein